MLEQPSSTCRHCGLPVPPARRYGPNPWFCCLGCRFVHALAQPSEAGATGERTPTTLLLRLGLGIFLTLNIMVSSWLSYSGEIFGVPAHAQGTDIALPALFSYLALFLCTLLVAMLGFPLLSDALQPFRSWFGHGKGGFDTGANVQTLIVTGVFAAYLLSAVHTLQGKGSLYYDTAAMVLVIVTLGSYLEAGAKRLAAAVASQQMASVPTRVRVRRSDGRHDIAAGSVRPGDLVQVRPGETVPVDGEVTEGTSLVDEASLTGESRPRSAGPGSKLLAGSMNLDGQLWLRAERSGEQTMLAHMERSLEAARQGRPPIQRLADRAAGIFVPGVVLLALMVFASRAREGQAGEGLLTGLAVLLISCPCALGLAAPLASWHGLRRAAECGILVDSAATLERAATVDRLYFDKTGTLTRPEVALEGITTAPGISPEKALAWAAGLESASTHPIAQTFLAAAAAKGIKPSLPRNAAAVPGFGVEGQIGGHRLKLGSARWLAAQGLKNVPLARKTETDVAGAVYLIGPEGLLARFDLLEEARPGAAAAIVALQRMGVHVGILSGDRDAPTHRLANQLGVPAESELLPDAKVARLAAARGSRGRIAMAGDGINDAPVLAAADIGISVGSASDLAQRSGNVRLLSDRLVLVPTLLRIARDTRRRIIANLLWSFGFNSIGIALAVVGWLTPVFAAAAMLLSSLTVIRISSRAGRVVSGEASPSASPAGRGRFGDLGPVTGETTLKLEA